MVHFAVIDGDERRIDCRVVMPAAFDGMAWRRSNLLWCFDFVACRPWRGVKGSSRVN